MTYGQHDWGSRRSRNSISSRKTSPTRRALQEENKEQKIPNFSEQSMQIICTSQKKGGNLPSLQGHQQNLEVLKSQEVQEAPERKEKQ